MIHYLYVGHFERSDTFIRFEKVSEITPALYRPDVQRPLDLSIVNELLGRWDTTEFPVEWRMGMREPGYIVWDRFCGNDDASEFIVQLANRTDCDLADYSSLTLMRADDIKSR